MSADCVTCGSTVDDGGESTGECGGMGSGNYCEECNACICDGSC